MELLWWSITLILFAVGLIGAVLPVLPGTAVILFAAILHRLMLGAEKSVSWWILVLMLGLTLASYALDFAAGYFGAKRFGATKWGALGAVIGAVVGLFFGIPGLFVGPIAGAVTLELVAGKRPLAAGRAGWGTLLGTIGGVLAKLVIALAMIGLFLLRAPAPF
jgi:uncharacterized protein YqgC (DUF456 family)